MLPKGVTVTLQQLCPFNKFIKKPLNQSHDSDYLLTSSIDRQSKNQLTETSKIAILSTALERE